jgi:hypothetical protein
VTSPDRPLQADPDPWHDILWPILTSLPLREGGPAKRHRAAHAEGPPPKRYQVPGSPELKGQLLEEWFFSEPEALPHRPLAQERSSESPPYPLNNYDTSFDMEQQEW